MRPKSPVSSTSTMIRKHGVSKQGFFKEKSKIKNPEEPKPFSGQTRRPEKSWRGTEMGSEASAECSDNEMLVGLSCEEGWQKT